MDCKMFCLFTVGIHHFLKNKVNAGWMSAMHYDFSWFEMFRFIVFLGLPGCPANDMDRMVFFYIDGMFME